MNGTLNNQLRMIRTTWKTLQDNGVIWADFVKFAAYCAALGIEIVIIDEKANLLMEIDGGPKAEKERLRALMVQSTMKVAGSGYSYADDENDTLLLEKMDFSKSELLNLVDAEQANRAEMVYNVIHPIVADLADYKIVAADLTELKSRVDAYREFLTAPKNNADVGAGLREELVVHKNKSMKLLKKLDKLMEHYKEDHHEFVTVYTKSRVIVDLGHRYRKPISFITGKTVKVGTGETLNDVKLTILGDEKHGVLSSNVGLFSVGAYQEGDLILVAEKTGYGRKEFPLVIVKGENQEMDIALEAVAPNPPDPSE